MSSSGQDDYDFQITEEILHELNLVVELLSSIDGWQSLVDVLGSNNLINEIVEESEFELTDEQLAVFTFWRLTSIEVSEQGAISNEFDDIDDPEDSDLLFALRTWKEEILVKEILSQDDYSLSRIAEAFDSYAPNSREEAEEIISMACDPDL